MSIGEQSKQLHHWQAPAPRPLQQARLVQLQPQQQPTPPFVSILPGCIVALTNSPECPNPTIYFLNPLGLFPIANLLLPWSEVCVGITSSNTSFDVISVEM